MVWQAQLVDMADDNITRMDTKNVQNTKDKGRKRKRKQRLMCCVNCRSILKSNERIVLAVLIFLLVIVSLSLLGLSISGAITVRLYSMEQSTRIAGLVLLAVTAALCLVLGLYAAVAPLKGERRTLYVISTALLTLAMSQIALLCTVVILSKDNESAIVRSLATSFRNARARQSRKNLQVWSNTQHDLSCCGLNGPKDYSTKNTSWPRVPLPCCHDYDPSRSEIVQEQLKKNCRNREAYFKFGCKGPVLDLFKKTVDIISNVAISVIVLEVLTALVGLVMSRKSGKEGNQHQNKIKPNDINNLE